jgi:Flp pilus assembly protein TadD
MGLFSRRSSRAQADPAQEAFSRGRALMGERQWAEAARQFARAVELAPHSVTAHLLHGAALTNAGHLDEAVVALRTCLQLDPDSAEGHNALGMALGKLGRIDEARQHTADAARLGHPQAAATMRRLKMDYCRECHRFILRAMPEEADVKVVGPPFGMQCTDCHQIRCVRCLPEGFEVPCPRCGGGLTVMEWL